MTFIIFNKRGCDCGAYDGAHDGAHEGALHTRKVAAGRWAQDHDAEHEGWRLARRRHVTCRNAWEAGQWMWCSRLTTFICCAGIGRPFTCAWGAAGGHTEH